jgi:hypothetical protein
MPELGVLSLIRPTLIPSTIYLVHMGLNCRTAIVESRKITPTPIL